MGTDAMRRTDIRIDKLTGHMELMQLYAVTGEYNGRSLRVQITNDGAIEDQAGVQLHFGFKSTATQKEGILVFSVVDATKGLYEVFYPTEMLEVPGTVVCAIRIVDSDSISKTVNFTVQVRKSVIHDDMEVPENSLKLIDKIAIDIVDHERRIAVMELNFETLSEMLTLNIPNMDVPVSTRASESGQAAVSETVNAIAIEMTLAKRKGLSQSFSTPGTYTFSVPNDTGTLYVTAVGAGAGGGGGGGATISSGSNGYANPAPGGGGGGGGGLAEAVLSVTPGEKITVQVGGGGAGGAAGPYRSYPGSDYQLPEKNRGGPGTSGGASRVGNNVIATGGAGGGGGGGDYSTATTPGAGGKGGTVGGNAGSEGGVPAEKTSPGGAGGGGGIGKRVGTSSFGKGGNGGGGSNSTRRVYDSDSSPGSSGNNGYVLIEW